MKSLDLIEDIGRCLTQEKEKQEELAPPVGESGLKSKLSYWKTWR